MSKIKIYISNKRDGDVKFNEENKKKIADKLSIPREKFYYINTSHGTNIYEIGKEKLEFFDGIITDKVNTPICAYSADCLGILFYDEIKKIIGVVHAGRVGTEREITQKMIKFFLEKGSKLENIIIQFGPSIGVENYEVSLDCGINFHKEAKKVISKEKQFLDIALENFLQLKNLGIPEKNILKNEINTYNDSNYFSHRRGDHERFGSFIWIEE